VVDRKEKRGHPSSIRRSEDSPAFTQTKDADERAEELSIWTWVVQLESVP
jgi:hypothetical protein